MELVGRSVSQFTFSPIHLQTVALTYVYLIRKMAFRINIQCYAWNYCFLLQVVLTSDTKTCSFQNWYPLFKEHTIQSIVVPISNDVVSYLLEDSTLILPEEVCNSTSNRYSDHEGDYLDFDSTDEISSEVKVKWKWYSYTLWLLWFLAVC